MIHSKPDISSSLIKRATEFTEKKFAAANIIPTHSFEVGSILQHEMNADLELTAAGILHDTLEDTATSIEELSSEFSPTIAKLVCEVSHKNNPSHSDRLAYYDQLKTVSPRAKLIKLADFLSHLRAFISIYEATEQSKHPKFVNNHLYIAQIRSFISSIPDAIPAKIWVAEAADRLESLHNSASW